MRIYPVILVFLSLFLFLAVPCAHSLSRISHELEKIRNQEPTFAEIVQEALKREKLQWYEIEKWKKKMRLAPWFPALALGYDHALRRTNALSITDNISVTNSGVTVGPDDQDIDESLYNGNTLRLRASWSLDEIVFNPATFQTSREMREMTKARLSLSDYIFKIYSERRKLLGEYYLLGGGRNSKSFIIREKILSLTEELDLLTSSVFTDQWWKGEK